jgi:hypothetical protein
MLTQPTTTLDLGVGEWTTATTQVKIHGACVCDKSSIKDVRFWDSNKKHFFIVADIKLTTLYARLRKLLKNVNCPIIAQTICVKNGYKVVEA